MSPRALVILGVAAVALVGVALWEILGADATEPAEQAAQLAEKEPPASDEPRQGAGDADEPRTVRKRPRRPVDDESGTTETPTEAGHEQAEGSEIAGQAPSLADAREGFAHVMEELELVGKSRRRINQAQWERHSREANDAFAALSMWLRAGDENERAELERAHKLLKARLGRLRVRGKKHKAP